MGECIHAGYLPLWNPYINFGIPQYGDMSSGYWSPITWLIATVTGYNAYTFTLEVLLYILLSGLGMYKLTGAFKLDNRVRVIAAIALMCGGFNTGHLQHFNWLSGAAFLPWCFWGYLQMLQNASIKNIIRAVLFFYLLVASAHPGITISAFYFFIALLIFWFFKNDGGDTIKKKFKLVTISHGIFLLLFVLLSSGMLAGYLDILPYFVRGEKLTLANSLSNPSNLQTWVSALLPLATVKADAFYHTDISMRNSYFSLTLLLFLLLAVFNKKNAWQKFLLVAGLLFALLAAGGIFKTFAYNYLPFIGYVRLNGEFTIFSLLCFILAAAIELDKFIRQKNKFGGTLQWIYYFIEVVVITSIITGIYKTFAARESFLFRSSDILMQNGLALKLKALVDALSFYDTLWIQGTIQLLILWCIKWCTRFGKWDVLQKILVADMVIACLLNIPFTGVGKASVAQVQAVLRQAPKGIPIPLLQPIKNIDSLPVAQKQLVGDWSLYNKQPGVKEPVTYPIVLKNMNAYFENNLLHPGNNFLSMPFIFIAGSATTNKLLIQNYSPNKIALSVDASTDTKVILQQNFYPHWFYKNGVVKKEVGQAGINFMSAPASKGHNNIVFSFEPTVVKWAILVSVVVFAICLFLMFIPTTKWPSLVGSL